MDVCLYMRYSSDNQTEQSIEGQHRVCKQFCDANGYNIVDVYIDRALSAFHNTAKRVEFQRMIADSEKHHWQGIVVYKLDRFARNRYDSATYKARLKKHGVRVISATENISDNPEGVLLESVLEGMAEFYSKELAQKVSRGMYETAQKCNNTGGVIPLGYKVENKKLVIDPITSPIVQEAFQMYADGHTVAEICQVFNHKGYKTSRGAEFNKNSFRSMFKNERYLGIYKYKDIRIEDGMPAIINKELFGIVQKRLAQNGKAPARGKAVVDYMLASKMFCGHCGKLMVGDCGRSSTGITYHYYSCSGRKRLNQCHKKPVPKDYIEWEVAKATMDLLTPETIEYLAEKAAKASKEDIKNNTLIPSLRQQIADAERAIRNLLKMVENGAESHALAERLNELEQEKRTFEKRLLKEESTVIELEKPIVEYWLSQFLMGDIENPEFRRHLIDMLVNSVFVFDNPDGGYDLDICSNLTSGKHTKITLSDISSASSDLALDGAPKRSVKCF